ncbi:MAG: DNA translocase FtsK [Candidatus Omnitrophica bacterium]|nr:DNA translocase FtsK [Candidatus Omnitrophota bacterium]
MKQEHINEIKAIIILAIGMIVLASLLSFDPADLSWYTSNPNFPVKNLVRISGAYIGGLLVILFGYSSYVLVLFLFFYSWLRFTAKAEFKFTLTKFISSFILFSVFSALFSLIGGYDTVGQFQRGGFIGYVSASFLYRYIGYGAYVFLLAIGALTFIISGELLISPLFIKIRNAILSLWVKDGKEPKPKEKEPQLKPKINIGQAIKDFNARSKEDLAKNKQKLGKEIEEEENPEENDIPGRLKTAAEKKPVIKISPQKEVDYKDKEPKRTFSDYQLPSLSLLSDPPKVSTDKMEADLVNNAKHLEQTLADFGVEAKVADIERGPVITRYELEPAPGVKVQKFTSLANDIALAMQVAAVRVVAPIPGKSRVGVEVPNSSSAAVYLKEVLASKEFRSAKSKIALSLGKDIAGVPIIADLAEMPHLLIAGTTGSGKTVCINSIIMSMLFNATPDEVRFIMIDPKMVEMAQYNGIPHLLVPTVTDYQKASAVLNWAVGEMENRYKRMSAAGVRNIISFNEKGEKMPYIVVIIDELADLMQVSAKTVESAITRLAQLSRAVGIHLVLATQKPIVTVITGVIKANLPARIAFNVASKVDSRTVLDMNGAETLLGKGDMLFIKPGDAKPTRGQCSYVKDDEVANVITFIREQQEPNYDESVLNHQKAAALMGGEPLDEFYDEAVKLVIETNQASVSILQRRLKLGYTRAARLIDTMEQQGVVGPYCGSKPREILVDREQWLLKDMENKDEQPKN